MVVTSLVCRYHQSLVNSYIIEARYVLPFKLLHYKMYDLSYKNSVFTSCCRGLNYPKNYIRSKFSISGDLIHYVAESGENVYLFLNTLDRGKYIIPATRLIQVIDLRHYQCFNKVSGIFLYSVVVNNNDVPCSPTYVRST